MEKKDILKHAVTWLSSKREDLEHEIQEHGDHSGYTRACIDELDEVINGLLEMQVKESRGHADICNCEACIG